MSVLCSDGTARTSHIQHVCHTEAACEACAAGYRFSCACSRTANMSNMPTAERVSDAQSSESAYRVCTTGCRHGTARGVQAYACIELAGWCYAEAGCSSGTLLLLHRSWSTHAERAVLGHAMNGCGKDCCGQHRLCSNTRTLRSLTSHVLVPEALAQVRIRGKCLHSVVAGRDFL